MTGGKNSYIARLIDSILSVDKSIRFVGVYFDGRLHKKWKKGIKSYLDEKEARISADRASIKWALSEMLSDKTGEPKFSIMVYKKVYMITLPSKDKKSLVLVSTCPEGDPFVLASRIEDEIEKMQSFEIEA